MDPAGLATSRAKSMSNLASPFASLSDSEEKLPLGWACADNLTLKLPDVTVGNNVYRPSLSRPTLPSRSRHALNRCPTLACRQTSCCFRCNECRPVMLIETSTRPNNSPLFTFYSNPDSHSRTSPSNTCRALAKAPKNSRQSCSDTCCCSSPITATARGATLPMGALSIEASSTETNHSQLSLAQLSLVVGS